MAADPIPAVVSIVKACNTINDRVEGRVYGAELAASEQRFQPRPAVVVNMMGLGDTPPGRGDWTNMRVSRVDIRSHGRMPSDAGEIGAELDSYLHQFRREPWENVLVYWFKRVSGGVFYRTQQGEWPVMVYTYDVLHADISSV